MVHGTGAVPWGMAWEQCHGVWHQSGAMGYDMRAVPSLCQQESTVLCIAFL